MEEKRDDTVYVFYLKEKKMKKKGTQKIEKVWIKKLERSLSETC